uniref:Uncharacterized protein n=1 Tax=Thermogemmatispora argillosa TaxID=2045280 RepID=A0A455T3D7_9CHLR|nr:hypothetical protein KTA_11940 [Thermogemmatispora argillosa]
MKIRQQQAPGLELVRRVEEQKPALRSAAGGPGESLANWRRLEESVAALGQAEEQAEAMDYVCEVWQAIAAARARLTTLPPARAWQILLWPFRRELAALAADEPNAEELAPAMPPGAAEPQSLSPDEQADSRAGEETAASWTQGPPRPRLRR